MENHAKKQKKQQGLAAFFSDWLDAVVWAAVLCVLLFTFCVKTFEVEGDSMLPTYHWGDRVLTVAPWLSVKPGDVVVTDDKNNLGEPLIKRVVATEFQEVSIDPLSGAILVDGVLFDGPFAVTEANLRGDMRFPVYVPEGCVFVLGDNRANSRDSRFSEIGFVQVRDILGKVIASW